MKRLLFLFISTIIGFSLHLPVVYCETVNDADINEAYEDKHAMASDAKDDAESQKKYYQDQKRGWYWNEKIPEKKKKEKKAANDNKVNDKKHFIPDIKNYSAEQLWNMHPDDFQDLLLAFHKKSVMSPTESNIKDYIYAGCGKEKGSCCN